MVLLLVVAVLATAGWLVAFSSAFAARQVQVTGVRSLTATEVRTTAQVPLGRPLARQDVRAIAARVAALRLVSSVTVTRTWPQTITVAITERTPVLALHRPDGYLLVDAVGFPFLTVSKLPHDVVVADVDATSATLLSQVGVVAAALPAKLRNRVATIQARTPDSIRLQLTDGDTVVWGSSEDSPLKAEVLTSLIKQTANTYDVSAPHYPAIR